VRIRLLARAEAEIASARSYLDLQANELGEKFLDDIHFTLRAIADDPASFSKLETLPGNNPYRRAPLKIYRYVVIFEILADEILVVAVAHTSRRPNYWLRRGNGKSL
jgi:toxin ParE1/3/4